MGGVLALVTVAIGACGSGSGETSGTGEDPADGVAFPVTIEHAYGETTLTEPPEDVVTVGLTDHDAVLALGVAPVGVTDWFGDHPHATWPWAQDELGDAEPEVIGDAATIRFEQIDELKPDLILAVYAGLTETEYDNLSQIAPTIAQPADYVDFGVPWDEQTLTIGRALGEAEKAEALVADVQRQIDETQEEHPQLEGATGLVASPYAGAISVYAPHDVRGRFLASLGLVLPPEIADLAGDEFSADLSYERIDLLDVDALVWIVNDVETDRPRFTSDPIYSSLDVHRQAHDLFIENLSTTGGALSFITVLSLPLLLDELVPQLAAAVDGRNAAD